MVTNNYKKFSVGLPFPLNVAKDKTQRFSGIIKQQSMLILLNFNEDFSLVSFFVIIPFVQTFTQI